MSSTVDTRVVQIQFDNAEFERNVQQTINSLERLNKALEGNAPGKGLASIADNLNNSDFGKVVSGVDSIKDRFSALGIVGMTVIQRLTNAGIDMATKIGGGIKKVGDQIAQGGFVRAQNLEQAKFLLEGLGADVKAVMQDVDDALTGTAYGLDEGAKSAAIFFTSGVQQGKEMYTALRAVAGAAAMTGSSYQGIADVFQDAAAKGSIMTMEITRLQQQGVKADKYLLDFINDVVEGGDKVSEVSDDVKKQVMDLTNGTKLSLEDLTEDRKGLLSKGAISFDVFAAAMDNAFGAHAQESNKTFAGSLANMKTALSRLGEAFLTPGMKAAIPIFNSIRTSISSFATALKEEGGAVDKFSKNITNLGEKIASTLDVFNGKKGNMNAFADLGHSVEKLLDYLYKAAGKVGEAFKEVFPDATIQNAKGLIIQFNHIITEFTKSEKRLNSLKNGFVIFFKIVKNVSGIIKTSLSVAFSILKIVLKAVSKPIEVITNGMAKLLELINKGLSGGLSGKVFELLGHGIDKAASLIEKAFGKIIEYFKLLTTSAKGAIENFASIEDVLAAIGVVFGGGFIARIVKSIKDFFDLKDESKKGFSKFIESISSLPERAGEALDSLTESLKTMQKQVSGKIIKDIALAVLALAVSLKILSTIDVPGLARGLGALTILLGEMMGALALIMKMVDSDKFAGSIKNLSKMQVLTTQLIKLGVALVLMAVALKIISSVDPKGLAVGLGGLIGILGAVLGFIIALDKFGGKKMAGKFKGVTEGLMGLALALLVLAAAVKVLSSMNIEELAKGLGSVVVLLGAIMGFIIGVSKLSSGGAKGMITTGIGMIAIATALNILAPALQKMGSLDMQTIGKGLLAISGALIAMAGASMFTSVVGAAMTFALAALAAVIERVGKLVIKVIALGLGTLIGSMLALAGTSVLLSAAILPMLGISGAMLIMAAAIAVLGAGLVMIGAGLAAIAGGIIAFSSVTQTAVLMFANTIQTMITAIIQMLPQVAVALAESFVGFLEEIASLAPRFTAAATTIITSLIEALENNVPRLVKTGLRLIVNFLEGLEEAIPRISKSCAEIIAGFIDGIAQGLPDIIQSGINLMIAFINGLAEGIRNNTEAVNAAIRNLCSAILESFMSFFGISSPSTVMEQQGVNLMQGLLNGIKSFGGIPGALLSAVKGGFTRIGSFISKFKTKGADIVKSIGAGIKGKASDIKTKIGDAISKAKEKVSGYVSNFKTAGKNLVSGVASGIKNGVSSVISAAGSIAQRALNKFKSKLGISSPSKVFAEAASWIPEGIAVGIKKTTRSVDKAVSNLSDRTVSPIEDAFAKIASFADFNDDFTPTITPVLDLSEVRKGASGIGSIFGNESVSLAASIGQNDIQNLQNNNLMNQLLTKMDKIMTSDSNPTNITNHFTVNGNDNPEQFVNTFIRTLDREMKMRAV